MKATLTIDMPRGCDCCRFMEVKQDFDIVCSLTYRSVACQLDTKPKECPLKPVPKQRDVSFEYLEQYRLRHTSEEEKQAYSVGWNDCIYVMTGETE